MTTLTDFLKCTDNPYAAIADDGIAAGDIEGFYDTGSYTLNALLSGSIYGGLPDSKCTGVAAESGVGKTFFALGALNQFLQDEPEGLGLIFESESAISKKMLQDRGIDTTRVGVIPCTTLQEFRTSVLKVIDNYEKQKEKDRKPLFFILDSLGMLATEKEVEDALEGKNVRDMTRSSTVRSVFRVITLRLGRARIPFFITNHVYANVTAMYGGNEVCLAAGAAIVMKDGASKPIESIEIGDEVLTIYGSGRVNKTYKYEDAELIELEFEDGKVIRCTPNHKFLVNNQWKTASNLVEEALNMKDVNISVDHYNEHAAYELSENIRQAHDSLDRAGA